MITLEIGAASFSLPQNWSEINLSTFIKISDLDLNFVKRKIQSQTEYNIQLINILTNIEVNELRRLSIDSYNEIVQAISFIWSTKSLLENEENKKEEVVIDDVVYKFIDLKKATLGETADYERIIQDFYGEDDSIGAVVSEQKNIFRLLPDLLAIVLMSEHEEYNAEKNSDRSKLFAEKLKIPDVYWFISFFLLIAKQSMMHSEDYIIAKEKEIIQS